MTYWKVFLGLTAAACALPAQTTPAQRQQLWQIQNGQAPAFSRISRQIWEQPEVGFSTLHGANLLKDQLRAAGFRIQDNIGGMSSAFVAEWGEGKPVIGILGEYDALPGLSQDAAPERKPIVKDGPGHGCGHNLLGSAAALAAVSVKEFMAANKVAGTLRFYGTPAEEGGAGKVYMLRAGAFRDVDVVLAWHPGNFNAADDNPMLANVSAKIRFRGQAAHAAAAPEKGRSALDALEVTTFAVNLMREHVPQETRMHYIITKGGAAPNIVPDFAELYLIARHPDQKTLEGIWERVLNCAKAGALATGTTVEVEVVSAYANAEFNPTLRDLLDKNVHIVGGVTYTEEEVAFAEKIRKSVDALSLPPLSQASTAQPPATELFSASSDVGDVSWNLPTGHLRAATFPPGVPLHSWQSTACAGTEIGRKGMMVAARTLALSALDLFEDPSLVQAAKASFQKRMQGRPYHSLIPEGKQPPEEAH
jgi:aminobenzoyl-glutamate utilization protein B